MRELNMINIPSYYREEMPFNEAVNLISNRAGGDLLEGMKSIEGIYDEFTKNPPAYSGYVNEDDFFSSWSYELNAFNVVFENMNKIF
jgi:hypothetical protein